MMRRTRPMGIFVSLSFTLSLAVGCQPPIEVKVALWTPEGVVQDSAGFDLSVVVAGNAGDPTRVARGEDRDIEGLTVPPDTGLDVDAVLIEAVGTSGQRIASGRTGPTTISADGTTAPASLTAILAPQGVVDLDTESPSARESAAVCVGGGGRTYVIGGIAPDNGTLLGDSFLIDPAARSAAAIEGFGAQRDGSCAVHVDTGDDGATTDTLWIAGGCNENGTPGGLLRSDDNGQSSTVIDATPLTCRTATSIFGDRLWILAGDRVQVRDATDGTLIAEAAVSPARYGGNIIAVETGAILGGGYEEESETTFTLTPLDFVTESANTLGFAPFGPDNVERVSFTKDSSAVPFALLTTAATVQVHRLQPAIAGTPVQIQAGPLTAGAFNPEHLIAMPGGTFLVLNEPESFAREFNVDGTTTDSPANAFGAQMVQEPGGAVFIVGGRAAGIKAFVRRLP